MTRRTERVSEELRGELSRLLREEATDPRIGLVTLTRVDLSPDFRNARVFWSSHEADDEDSAAQFQDGLDSAAAFLRRRLAQLLPIKRVPALEFRHDRSLELGSQTLSMLKDLDGGSE